MAPAKRARPARRADTRAAVIRAMAWSGATVFVADRLSKVVVIDYVDLPHRGLVEVVPPFLNLVMAWNRGINFGLLGGLDMRWVLVAVAVAVSVGVAWWVLKRRDRRLGWGAGALVGGAIGNAWDRVQYGAVADFLNMSCCGIQNPYAFNIADVAIFAGAIWLAWKA